MWSTIKRVLKYSTFPVLLIFIGVVGYFYYDMTIGDTWNLEENLKNVEGVERIDEYMNYEGLAFVTLSLAGGGLLVLGGVGNTDLKKTNGFTVRKVGSTGIVCRATGRKSWMNGIPYKDLVSNYLPDKNIQNIPDLIANYQLLDAIVRNSSFKLVLDRGEYGTYICRSKEQ